MFVFNGFNFQTTKKVVDIGPIQVDKKENHSVGWPMYVGGIAVLAGVAVLAMGSRKA
jgi:hypothetical protein